ncbi:Golgi membrane exchange factor (Ric1p-Rgp1p) subunit [Friedmanniomyces endolithicus]|nr:Golgi membrane exchange factor (Ric1p-Rgp1p) subunit [Friedmanniomyces endolithicus]KAK0780943.1 Golgi membrane exchange factor (Ric1p-Rgp1p) subunit [Friedmanniomyces endolithicus]KAK0789400.1 Golgi membrane exchange factor (Ric1p-Rgp1p) subunit [Friedmanniomyces endolithicus]KAK0799361.1 Golgi membrane exchange factor (Ric1p-Rgp1p) subunit [Friedmanniomyces endolithicus]KAK0842565.1 Golgi membrane exchange factor (Ric1p-Rgp1p) subunit [Friedmanniomyces endolithicus]
MFRWLVPQRTTEKIAESFINVYPRQQRAQAFYQRHQRFGTRSSLRQEATARSGDEYEAPSDLSLPPAAAHDDPSGTATALAPVKRSFRASGSPRSAASKATPASALVPKSRIESRIERKTRRMTAGTYKPAASAMDKQQEEEERIQTVLAKLDDMEEPARPNLGDAIPQTPKTVKKSKVETRSNTKPGVRESGREKRLQPKPKRDPWELQKDALEHKFGETGWQPRKRLSPDTLDGIRALHASDPGAYSTETLSDHFKIAPEAIRRILKSKWRPNEGETDDRRARWERRGVKKWQEMHELGMRPPVKWRALGVGGAEGVVEERMPKRRKAGRTDGGLSWDEVVGALASSAMPPAATPSNIRAYVQWREPTVYSGEDIECIITFKNIGRTVEEEQGEDVQTPLASVNGYGHGRTPSYATSAAPSRRTSIAQSRPTPSRTPSGVGARDAPASRGHRPALSLNVMSASSRAGLRSAPSQVKTPQSPFIQSAKGHGRSLSIMSLGSDAPSDSRPSIQNRPPGMRPVKGHSRSASLQVSSKSAPSPANVGLGIGTPRQPSPLYESVMPPALPEGQDKPLSINPGRRRPGIASADSTPQLGRRANLRRSPQSMGFGSEFEFPAQPAGRRSPSSPEPNDSPTNTQTAQQRPLSPRPPDGWSGALSNLNPIARVMSESSTVSNTPRSSSDFYSMSNHSDETVKSEAPYHSQQNGRLLPNLAHTGRAPQSRQSSFGRPAKAETLMMGYVQTMGNFTLDGSLVNAAPFEEVKRKGVQTGGGVVGVDRSKRTSGMFGAFSWGNIGESLGGLLGGDETSSIAQMKATAGSRSIPLLSTPQSLLFVDLRLAPGESRNYSYRFALPRGLPPSHRGRALKVQYHLSITVQRPGAQNMRHVDVPFRVLGSYNARGETLGHDLMSPYILLQDTARTASITPDPTSPFGGAIFSAKEPQKTVKTPKQGLEDFLRYTERLLEPSESASGALLSPTSPSSSPSTLRKHSTIDQPPASIKEAIDFAVLRSNFAKPSFKQNPAEAQSPNRFNIARAGHPVAILTLLRPAYRLGEAVTGLIDFTSPLPAPSGQQPPHAPTYAVFLELESAERVDPSLALRSGSSIRRVTRKSYAALRENTLFARQVPFSLTVPGTATPSFETTGVSLGWRLRVEFTTQREQLQQGGGGEVEERGGMLEELGRDERGTALIASERLVADTFEVAIPLKVYGAAGVEGVGGRSEALEV